MHSEKDGTYIKVILSTGKAWFSEPLNSEHSWFSELSSADQNFT